MATNQGLYYYSKEEIDEINAYSTSEQAVGTWIDGSPIYKKTISIGALPNNTSKDVAHGVASFGQVLSATGFAHSTTDTWLNIPTASSAPVTISTNSTNIHINTYSDRTAYTECYITMYYTRIASEYNGPYGIVYYKSSSSSTTVKSVALQSAAQLNSLVGTDSAALDTVTVNGVTLSSGANTNSNVIVAVAIGKQITAIPDYFLKGCVYLNNPLTIPKSVTTIGDEFLQGCTNFNQALTLSENITTIGSNFLGACDNFNQAITLPSGLTSIGDNFLSGCSNFNQALALPDTLTTIGDFFLYSCTSFNQDLALPSGLTSIGWHFLHECDSMVGEVNVGELQASINAEGGIYTNYAFASSNMYAFCFTTGIKITGTNRAEWIEFFPSFDASAGMYRNLVDGEAQAGGSE